MKYENYPDIAELIKAIKATWVNFIYKSESCSSIFDKATLPWCTKLFSETGFQETDRTNLQILTWKYSLQQKQALMSHFVNAD